MIGSSVWLTQLGRPPARTVTMESPKLRIRGEEPEEFAWVI